MGQTQTKSMKEQSSGFPFLDLPLIVRDRIYSYLIAPFLYNDGFMQLPCIYDPSDDLRPNPAMHIYRYAYVYERRSRFASAYKGRSQYRLTLWHLYSVSRQIRQDLDDIVWRKVAFPLIRLNSNLVATEVARNYFGENSTTHSNIAASLKSLKVPLPIRDEDLAYSDPFDRPQITQTLQQYLEVIANHVDLSQLTVCVIATAQDVDSLITDLQGLAVPGWVEALLSIKTQELSIVVELISWDTTSEKAYAAHLEALIIPSKPLSEMQLYVAQRLS